MHRTIEFQLDAKNINDLPLVEVNTPPRVSVNIAPCDIGAFDMHM